MTSASSTSDSEVASSKQPPSSRKRKRPNSVVEKVESVTSAIIIKLTEMQKSSDDLIRDLEEKRMKYEERQDEHEEQQGREGRQFPLQMMQMIMGHRPPPHASNVPTTFLWFYVQLPWIS